MLVRENLLHIIMYAVWTLSLFLHQKDSCK